MTREQQAAERTLQQLGYTYHGGEQWKPPIGQAPDFDLIDSLRERIAQLEAQAIAQRAAEEERQACERECFKLIDISSRNAVDGDHFEIGREAGHSECIDAIRARGITKE